MPAPEEEMVPGGEEAAQPPAEPVEEPEAPPAEPELAEEGAMPEPVEEPAAPEPVEEAAGQEPAEPREAEEGAEQEPGKVAGEQQPPPEWDALLRKLRQEYAVGEQQKEAQSEEHYKMAERYYRSTDFDRAALECEKALKLNPNHAAASALKHEIDFLRNRGAATPESEYYRDIMNTAIARHQQLLVEVDKKISKGQRHYNLGEYEDAEREFRMVLEYAKWMPTGPGIDDRRVLAIEWLERTKQAHQQQMLDEEIAKRVRAEEERQKVETIRIIEERRQLEVMFGQAQLHFEREEYQKCMNMCDRILYIEPNLNSVIEMKMVSMRLRQLKADHDLLKTYVEEWKRNFEELELAVLVPCRDLEFPERSVWDFIRKRKPRGIQESLEDETDPADQAILEKLRAIRITIDMQDAPLADVIEYIREISGLNFVIDSQNVDRDDPITIKVSDIILEGALKLILNPRDYGFYVEGGVVIITSGEAIGMRTKLEMYDVQDLIFSLRDFPGVDISLRDERLHGAFRAEEESEYQPFTGEDLVDLIERVIDPEGWGEGDKSIMFQNGLLIVTTTADVHRKIQKFLSDLRLSTGIIVNIEARFLACEDRWLEQVGMDFRDLDIARDGGILDLDDINPTAIFTNLPIFTPEDPAATFYPGGNPNPPGLRNPVSAFGQLTLRERFLPGTAAAGSETSAGITWAGGDDVTRLLGTRVQHIMNNDFLVNRYWDLVFFPLGGATIQYTLLDDVSLEAILKLVSRSERNQILTA
ncbi:MAG: tetratricopeptide repeat protein, partial [Planctomycetota bacterium]